MGAKRIQYQIVGRYMAGKEVTGYHLQSLENGKSGKFSREAVAYLVGRDQITNCKGQVYNQQLLLRGEGMSLEDLPVQQEDGMLTRTDSLGHIRRGTSAADAMTQVMLVAVVAKGRTAIGYYVQNAGGAKQKLDRATVMKMAQKGQIGNARVQLSNGQAILRGVGCDLRDLPVERVE